MLGIWESQSLWKDDIHIKFLGMAKQMNMSSLAFLNSWSGSAAMWLAFNGCRGATSEKSRPSSPSLPIIRYPAVIVPNQIMASPI